MNVKVADLMVEQVVVARPHHTVERVRRLMETNHIHAVPIVDDDETPVGIVSAADLVPELKAGTPVQKIMTTKVYSIPRYDDVHVAARLMRNHRIHHVVVTHEQKLVGMLSSFDLLALVEDHRFTVKQGPTPSSRKGAKRS